MSDKEYRSAAGFVQFDPKVREVAGKSVRDVTIRPVGSANYVRVTVWPSHRAIEINRGDFLAVDGQYSRREVVGDDGSKTVYHNLSASMLAVLQQAPQERDNVATSPASTEDDGDDPW